MDFRNSSSRTQFSKAPAQWQGLRGRKSAGVCSPQTWGTSVCWLLRTQCLSMHGWVVWASTLPHPIKGKYTGSICCTPELLTSFNRDPHRQGQFPPPMELTSELGLTIRDKGHQQVVWGARGQVSTSAHPALFSNDLADVNVKRQPGRRRSEVSLTCW